MATNNNSAPPDENQQNKISYPCKGCVFERCTQCGSEIKKIYDLFCGDHDIYFGCNYKKSMVINYNRRCVLCQKCLTEWYKNVGFHELAGYKSECPGCDSLEILTMYYEQNVYDYIHPCKIVSSSKRLNTFTLCMMKCGIPKDVRNYMRKFAEKVVIIRDEKKSKIMDYIKYRISRAYIKEDADKIYNMPTHHQIYYGNYMFEGIHKRICSHVLGFKNLREDEHEYISSTHCPFCNKHVGLNILEIYKSAD